MLGRMREVFVCGEKRQIVPNRELCQQCINGAELNSRLATGVSESRSTNVIFPIGLKQGQRGKALNDLSSSLGAREPLK